MSHRTIIATLFFLLITGAVGCQRSPAPAGDASSTPATETPSAVAAPSPVQPAAVTAADLQAVIMRTYKDAVFVDPKRPDNFVTGDFNGDKSEDIAIVVKPGDDKLSDLNSDVANWILEDPISVGIRVEQMGGHKLPEKSATVRVRNQDVLLAVIHGYQGAGWRDPKATQTYLLKNATSDKMETEARPRGSAAPQNQASSSKGDIIREIHGNTAGFIYWTGAKYAWHVEPATR